jgi:hypothetical protein
MKVWWRPKLSKTLAASTDQMGQFHEELAVAGNDSCPEGIGDFH